jgi:hypothetical protein
MPTTLRGLDSSLARQLGECQRLPLPELVEAGCMKQELRGAHADSVCGITISPAG